MMQLKLDECFNRHGTDKGTMHPVGGHGYAAHYAPLLDPIRYDNFKLLEIGVGGGESVRAWLEYFPSAKVFGVDNVQGTNPWNTVKSGIHDRYTFVYGDQTDTTFWECFKVDYHKDFKVIIDDGGHFSNQIVTTFVGMWDALLPGGVYCVEDVDCGFTPGTIFCPPGSPTHAEFIKGFVEPIQTAGYEMTFMRLSKGLLIFGKR